MITTQAGTVVRRSIISRLFGREELILINKTGILLPNNCSILWHEMEHSPKLTRWVFSYTLSIPVKNRIIKCRGIRPSDYNKLIQEIDSNFRNVIIKRVTDLLGHYKSTAVDRFIRDSQVNTLEKSIEKVNNCVKQSKNIGIVNLDNKAIQQLNLSTPLPVEKIRQSFEYHRLEDDHQFFHSIENNPLTKSQSLAVIRDNDFNLVLAAAGTGKTSVMVAKAIYLLKNRLAAPEEILVLAYNQKAVQELRERIIERMRKTQLTIGGNQSLEISTFHALGRRILKETDSPSFISKMAEDKVKKSHFIHGLIASFLEKESSKISTIINVVYPPYDSFGLSLEEEERLISNNRYRTLNGDLVRSYEEFKISNWLYSQGIEFEYEPNYKRGERVEIGFDYKPDFGITGTNIYIEHYGIDRRGNTRPDIDKKTYNQQIKSKRKLHKKCGTTLIETYHYEFQEQNLLINLDDKLDTLGVEKKPRRKEDLFNKVNELGMVSKFSEIVTDALGVIRSESLTMEDVKRRLSMAGYEAIDEFCDVISYVKEQYEQQLSEEGSIDFDDMINQASIYVADRSFKSPWKYVLIDEFQDISLPRYKLVKSIFEQSKECSIMAVGDDWQSIYRFSGANIEIVTNFEQFFGSHSLTKLDKTFRYNNSIAEIAGTFIAKNPSQYKKNIDTHIKLKDPQVYLLDTIGPNGTSDLSHKITLVIDRIRGNDKSGTIVVMARYNLILDNLRQSLSSRVLNMIDLWTFHKSKGREANYTLIVGLDNGSYGFPEQRVNAKPVEALLPAIEDFPNAEERRLFYVALTRAKNKAYLLSDPSSPSVFINELIVSDYPISINSQRFKNTYRRIFKCPRCATGYLQARKSKFKKGNYFKCSAFPACRNIVTSCERCGFPTHDDNEQRRCNNPACEQSSPLCPACYRPLVVRYSKYGAFWGCTGYGSKTEPGCTYKSRL